jgi:prepilin-type N-terminal cleavage/methylation domain-containing protein
MNATQKKNQGFTLVELLVVVAIIAVIGAGVAVTYQRLDDKAKTAMEISDVSILKKVVKHWSAINSYTIPDELDSLVDSNGDLYSQMPTTTEGIQGAQGPSDSGRGLYGPAGYTFMVHPAPDVVLANLSAAGMTMTYTHLVDAINANDSTFETGMMGGEVDTDNTLTTLASGDSAARASAQEIVDEKSAAEAHFDPLTWDGSTHFTSGSHDWADLGSYQSSYDAADLVLKAKKTDKLAFIYPGGGATMTIPGGPTAGTYSMGMNLTDEIITNAGLKPSEVADPTASDFSDKKYFLVAMGFGRFASIYRGKSIRADAPAYGKRQAQNAGTYNRYLAIFRVPVIASNTMTGASELPALVDVLTPQGYSVASLRDNYIDDEAKVRD